MESVLLRRLTVFLAVLVLFASLLVPAQVVAQGNGRRRGQAKKTGKFVNGHDARDGRWDGRGPKAKSVWTTRGRGRHRGWTTRRQRRHHRVGVVPIR